MQVGTTWRLLVYGNHTNLKSNVGLLDLCVEKNPTAASLLTSKESPPKYCRKYGANGRLLPSSSTMGKTFDAEAQNQTYPPDQKRMPSIKLSSSAPSLHRPQSRPPGSSICRICKPPIEETEVKECTVSSTLPIKYPLQCACHLYILPVEIQASTDCHTTYLSHVATVAPRTLVKPIGSNPPKHTILLQAIVIVPCSTNCR
jgi:hypothetical protein